MSSDFTNITSQTINGKTVNGDFIVANDYFLNCNISQPQSIRNFIPEDGTVVFGCTNPSADNYNPLANVEDGSCIFFLHPQPAPIPPNINRECGDPRASNYNPYATNNSNCIFPPPVFIIQPYCTTFKSYIYRSSDYGITWTTTSISPSSWSGVEMSANGRYQTAVANNDYIYNSDNYGATWATNTMAGYKNWTCVAMTSSGQYQLAGTNNNDYLYLSNNYGVTWNVVNDINVNPANWIKVAISSFDGQYMFAISLDRQTIVSSSDYGVTWSENSFNTELHDVAVSSNGQYQTIVSSLDSIFISNDYGNNWITVNPTLVYNQNQWTSVAMSADGSYQTAVAINGFIFVSEDYGQNWSPVTSANVHDWISVKISSDGQRQTAVVYRGYIYESNDYGATWTSRANFADWKDVALSSDGQYQTAVVFSEDTILITTEAHSTTPIIYNWYYNNVYIPNEHRNFISTISSGTYYATATNYSDIVIKSDNLNVLPESSSCFSPSNPPPPPPPGKCGDPTATNYLQDLPCYYAPPVVSPCGEFYYATMTTYGIRSESIISKNIQSVSPHTSQWYRNNVLIAGAIDDTYNFSGDFHGTGGSATYKIVVTNSGGTVECNCNVIVTPKVGCTDPRATNYDDEALIDNGLCIIPPPPPPSYRWIVEYSNDKTDLNVQYSHTITCACEGDDQNYTTRDFNSDFSYTETLNHTTVLYNSNCYANFGSMGVYLYIKVQNTYDWESSFQYCGRPYDSCGDMPIAGYQSGTFTREQNLRLRVFDNGVVVRNLHYRRCEGYNVNHPNYPWNPWCVLSHQFNTYNVNPTLAGYITINVPTNTTYSKTFSVAVNDYSTNGILYGGKYGYTLRVYYTGC